MQFLLFMLTRYRMIRGTPGEDHFLCDAQFLGMVFLTAAGPYDALRISLCHGQHTDSDGGKQDVLRNICTDAVIRLSALICNTKHRMDRFQRIQMFLQFLVLCLLAIDEGLVITAETQQRRLLPVQADHILGIIPDHLAG